MQKKDFNDLFTAKYKQPPGTCLHLRSAGFLTGGGQSHYTITPVHFGPHLIVRGKGTFCWPGGRADVTVGTMFALLPGMSVDYWEDPDNSWQYQWLDIRGAEAIAFARGCGFTMDRPVWQCDDFEPILEVMRELRECLNPQSHAHPYVMQSKLYAYSTLSAMACGALRMQDHEATLVDRAKNVIESQLHTPINVSEIAAILRVSRTTLFYAFREELEQSPVQFLRARRIEKAKELLQKSKALRLCDIARACGFSDAKYFMRTFKEFVGQTPSVWREKGK